MVHRLRPSSCVQKHLWELDLLLASGESLGRRLLSQVKQIFSQTLDDIKSVNYLLSVHVVVGSVSGR